MTTLDTALAFDPGSSWQLSARSPARGAADPALVSDLSTDIDGQPRPSPSDVGCDQFSSAPATNRPLTARDVGPAWLARTK